MNRRDARPWKRKKITHRFRDRAEYDKIRILSNMKDFGNDLERFMGYPTF